MIDPTNVTNFERTPAELEEFMLFSIVVAGKESNQQAKKLSEFLHYKGDTSPFGYIRQLDVFNTDYINRMLRQVKMGQYNRITTAFRGVAQFLKQAPDYPILSWVTVENLQCIKGIGMKTARFFIMHSRANQKYACLDTHVLKWLAAKGHTVPKSTPQGDNYLQLEKVFLGYCEQLGKSPAELDLQIWNESHINKNVETA